MKIIIQRENNTYINIPISFIVDSIFQFLVEKNIIVFFDNVLIVFVVSWRLFYYFTLMGYT